MIRWDMSGVFAELLVLAVAQQVPEVGIKPQVESEKSKR